LNLINLTNQDQLQIISDALFYQLIIQTCQDCYKISSKLLSW